MIRLTGKPLRTLGWKVFEHCKMEEPSIIEHPILKRNTLRSSTPKTHPGTGARFPGTCPPACLGWIFPDGGLSSGTSSAQQDPRWHHKRPPSPKLTSMTARDSRRWPYIVSNMSTPLRCGAGLRVTIGAWPGGDTRSANNLGPFRTKTGDRPDVHRHRWPSRGGSRRPDLSLGPLPRAAGGRAGGRASSVSVYVQAVPIEDPTSHPRPESDHHPRNGRSRWSDWGRGWDVASSIDAVQASGEPDSSATMI